ncbi:MAG: ATP-grasp domain-containing protein [Bacteroidetes bacterium]|nr:ATP-grasp domain-containing protein [Bacteroidota bacterium]
MKRKKVVILINAISETPTADELDVLIQAVAIETELKALGYVTERLFMGLNMQQVTGQLKKTDPVFVFNLVESLDGSGKLIYFAPALLEHLHIPFTGSSSEAFFVTSNKMLAKSLMLNKNLPTPEWIESDFTDHLKPSALYIAKPVWEDASVGITDASVLRGDKNSVKEFLEKHNDMPYFFEEFIEGREFNISVLGGKRGPEVLPMAEIVFEQYPAGKPKIVGYEAKWDENSFAYQHTVRSFGVEKTDPVLAEKMRQICIDSWKLFGLKGYTRVDFRVDGEGNPWILEINANPCLSPDAGFYAASMQAGYSFKHVVERICEDVWK